MAAKLYTMVAVITIIFVCKILQNILQSETEILRVFGWAFFAGPKSRRDCSVVTSSTGRGG